MTLVYIFNGYFVRAFRFYRALKMSCLPVHSLSPSQIYDDSTAADSTQRTDRRTDKGTDRGTLDGQFLISFCVVHEKMTTLKHKTFQFVLKMKLAIYFLHFVVLPRLVSFHLACSCLVARFTPLTLSEMKGNVA